MQKGAIQKSCKNTKKRAQLGEPVSNVGWASQYRARVGGPVSSPQRVGRTSVKPNPWGVKISKKNYCRSTSFLTANDSAKKTGKIFTLFDAGAVPTRRRLPGLGTVPARETPLDHRWPSKPANLVPCLEASKRSKSLKNKQKRAKNVESSQNKQKTCKNEQNPTSGRVQSGCN